MRWSILALIPFLATPADAARLTDGLAMCSKIEKICPPGRALAHAPWRLRYLVAIRDEVAITARTIVGQA